MIVFFDFVHHFGGAQKAIIDLVNRLNVHNRESIYLCANNDCIEFTEYSLANSIQVKYLVPTGIGLVIKEKNRFRTFFNYIKFVRDIILITTKLVKAIKCFKSPYIVTTSPKGLIILLIGSFFYRYRISFYFHGDANNLRKIKLIKLGLYIRLIKSIIVLSEEIKRNYGNKTKTLKYLKVLSNAIDIENPTFNKFNLTEIGINSKNYILSVLLPATVIEAKGIKIAIQSAIQLKKLGFNIALYIAGTFKHSNFTDDLVAIIKNENCQNNVFFLGWRKDIYSLMNDSDIIVLPSYSEGFPLVLLEAMALKKPIIATNVGGVIDIINDGVNGFLMKTFNSVELSELVIQLKDPQIRQRFGENGHNIVKNNFTIKKQIEKFEILIKSN